MKIGFVGLGKMGSQMVERLITHHHEVVAFDLSENARRLAASNGAVPVESLKDLAGRLQPPGRSGLCCRQAHRRMKRSCPWPPS